MRGGAEHDVTILRIDLLVPTGATCLQFDFRFLTEESAPGGQPGGPFSDAFIAELDTSDWLDVDGELTAPNTFAITPGDRPVTVADSEFYLLTTAAIGTVYDRATPIWHAATPVTGGEQHALYLTVFDSADSGSDSAVFIDQLTFGDDQGAAGCEPGPTLVTQVFADAPTSLPGGQNGYRILAQAVGGQLPEPVGSAGSALTAPLDVGALAALSTLLPSGFAYVAGSTVGATTVDATVAADGTLTWAAPFAAAPAPLDHALELHFKVTVADKPGTYTNDTTAVELDGYFLLPPQPTAPIDVVLPAADVMVTHEQRPTPAVVDEKLELELTVTNQGPQTATGTTLEGTLPAALQSGEVTSSQGACALGDLLECKLGDIASGASVSITVSGVLGSGGVALGASVKATEVDNDLANNTLAEDAALAREEPTPVVGETVATEAKEGTVRVRAPDEPKFVEIDAATEIPVGSTIDARKGEVKITAAVDEDGVVQAARFARGKFVVDQRDNGLTTLRMLGGDFSRCNVAATAKNVKGERSTQKFIKDGARRAKKNKRRVIRRLWGRGKGRFRTRGRFAAATVRGTVWRTVDRCDGTLIRVKRGVVIVRDVPRKRAVKVRAGQAYLVKRPPLKRRPRAVAPPPLLLS